MSQKEKDYFNSLLTTYPESKKLFNINPKSVNDIKDDCIIILDTNVLILPYTTSPNSLDEIEKIYRELISKKNLLIPSHVVREFVKNRSIKITELHSSLTKKRNNIQNIATKTYPILSSIAEYSQILEIEKDINQKIQEYRNKIGNLLSIIENWNINDPVSRVYRDLFSEELIFDFNYNVDIKEAIQKRFDLKIPPGYKDASKEDNKDGDCIIWFTILNIGKQTKKNVLFVTGEEKSDWWYKSESNQICPRFELIEEYYRCSDGHTFQMANFSRFLELFNVEKEIIEEIKFSETTKRYESYFKKNKRYQPIFNDVEENKLKLKIQNMINEYFERSSFDTIEEVINLHEKKEGIEEIYSFKTVKDLISFFITNSERFISDNINQDEMLEYTTLIYEWVYDVLLENHPFILSILKND